MPLGRNLDSVRIRYFVVLEREQNCPSRDVIFAGFVSSRETIDQANLPLPAHHTRTRPQRVDEMSSLAVHHITRSMQIANGLHMSLSWEITHTPFMDSDPRRHRIMQRINSTLHLERLSTESKSNGSDPEHYSVCSIQIMSHIELRCCATVLYSDHYSKPILLFAQYPSTVPQAI